jgi:hypothetical protein
MLWLKCQDEYWQRKFEKRNVGIGAGAQSEATLIWILEGEEDGKVTESRVNRRYMGKWNADRILKRYWSMLEDDVVEKTWQHQGRDGWSDRRKTWK